MITGSMAGSLESIFMVTEIISKEDSRGKNVMVLVI